MASNTREVCTICQDYMRQNTTTLACNHTFCSVCVEKYIDSQPNGIYQCPNCRESFTQVSAGVGQPHQTLTDYFCDVPVYVNDTDRLAFEQRVEKAIEEARQAFEIAQRETKSIDAKVDRLEESINKRFDAVVRVAERDRENAIGSLRVCTKTALTENEETVQNLQNRLEALSRVKQQMDDAQKLGTGNVERLLSKGNDHLLGPQKRVILLSPVLRFTENFIQVQENIVQFIGTAHKIPATPMIPEMKTVNALDTETVCDHLCELRSLQYVDYGQKGAVVISYVTEEKNVAVQVSESAEILKRAEDIDVEGYRHMKIFQGKTPMLPIQSAGTSSSFSKSTKSAIYRLNAGDEGRGEILQVKLASTNPLTTKNKTVRRITCGHHRAFDADEDGKMFVVLEEAQTPGESCKVRLFTRKSSRPVATYQPPQQPFQPTDLVLYNLNGERVLLVADGATDKIHVIGFKDKRLVFLRYLALDACQLSQPCALEIDVHNRLWVACRDGKVFAFAPNEGVISKDVADTEVISPAECSPRRSFGLTAAAKILNAFCRPAVRNNTKND